MHPGPYLTSKRELPLALPPRAPPCLRRAVSSAEQDFRRWGQGQPGAAPGGPFTAAERNALWEHAARTADAAARIRFLARTDPAAAADAAWAASDTLHVAAAALGSRILRQAADAYDRAARAPDGRIPAPGPAGNRLRQAARLISAFAYLTRDPALTPIVLLTRLAALAEARAARIPAARRPGRCCPRRRRTAVRRRRAGCVRTAAGPSTRPHGGPARRAIVSRPATCPYPAARIRAARRGPGRPTAGPQAGTAPAAARPVSPAKRAPRRPDDRGGCGCSGRRSGSWRRGR